MPRVGTRTERADKQRGRQIRKARQEASDFDLPGGWHFTGAGSTFDEGDSPPREDGLRCWTPVAARSSAHAQDAEAPPTCTR
jgi:hypothetical protein